MFSKADFKKITKKMKEDNKHLPDYHKLIKDCDESGKHLKINLEKNICEHCYRLIELPKGLYELTYESELKSRRNMDPLDIPCDAGYWLDKIRNERENQKSIEFLKGFYRYLETLKNK